MKEIKKKTYIAPLTDVIVIQQYKTCLLNGTTTPTEGEGGEGDEDDLGW